MLVVDHMIAKLYLISGGWLLVSNVVIDSPSSPQLSAQTSYRGISSYHNKQTFLTKSVMNQLRTHLSFSQLRFHCNKQQGRTFHVTVCDCDCGLFSRMENDNSGLAGVCDEWEFDGAMYEVGKWGSATDEDRLYHAPAFVRSFCHWLLNPAQSRWECDDEGIGASFGDFWKIFVR